MSSRDNTTSSLDSFRATVEKFIDIDASPALIFESIIEDMQSIPDANGQSMGLTVEAKPGGRWYRNLPDDTGHLWAHVQVIKPPTLIEVYGPLMISAAAISHVTWRIKPEGKGQRLTITHRIFGDFDQKVPSMVSLGWQAQIDRIAALATKKSR